jgi:hypothetical protein
VDGLPGAPSCLAQRCDDGDCPGVDSLPRGQPCLAQALIAEVFNPLAAGFALAKVVPHPR